EPAPPAPRDPGDRAEGVRDGGAGGPGERRCVRAAPGRQAEVRRGDRAAQEVDWRPTGGGDGGRTEGGAADRGAGADRRAGRAGPRGEGPSGGGAQVAPGGARGWNAWGRSRRGSGSGGGSRGTRRRP